MQELTFEQMEEVNGGMESCAGTGTVAGATITADGAITGVIVGTAVGGPIGAAVGAAFGILGALVGAYVGVEVTEACEAAKKQQTSE